MLRFSTFLTHDFYSVSFEVTTVSNSFACAFVRAQTPYSVVMLKLQFASFDNFYCKYSYVYGVDWKQVAGVHEGLSAKCEVGHQRNNIITVGMPIEATFTSTNPFGCKVFAILVEPLFDIFITVWHPPMCSRSPNLYPDPTLGWIIATFWFLNAAPNKSPSVDSVLHMQHILVLFYGVLSIWIYAKEINGSAHRRRGWCIPCVFAEESTKKQEQVGTKLENGRGIEPLNTRTTESVVLAVV